MARTNKFYLSISMVVIVAAFCLVGFTPAWGSPIQLSGSTEVGGYTAVGSATISYVLNPYGIDDYQLVVTIENTSPTTDSGGNSNSPAIVGFGFNVDNSVNDIAPFMVTAFGFVSGSGSGPLTDITSGWELETEASLSGGGGGITFNFLPHTASGVNYGLINPDADGLTGSDLYETTATFYITFDDDPGELTDWALRFQNVGLDGEGSLKVYIPIPGAVWLLGSGLIGLVALRRKIKY